MGDLTQFRSADSPIVDAIYAFHKARGDAETPRTYLGASIIGHECDRYLWYSFRQCFKPSFDGRMYRLFDRGNIEEPRFLEELRGIGCEVIAEVDGEQIGVSGVGGHFKGHLDGAAKGIPEAPATWHVLEIKTHKDTSFSKLVSVGVKTSNPTHYAQMMAYMGLTKMERALYLACNKNTDEIYSERVRYDSKEFQAIMRRAERIITDAMPSNRCTTRPDDFRCKWCDASEICWHMDADEFRCKWCDASEICLHMDAPVPLPSINCRSCCHATPELDGDGRWSCQKHQEMAPCQDHLLIPGLINWAKPVDAGDDWIELQLEDGSKFKHGKAFVPTAILIGVKPEPDPTCTLVGEDPEPDLIDQYPPEDSRLRWHGKDSDFSVESAGLQGLEITRRHDTETYYAVEYDGRFLFVWYKADEYAAVWEGVE